MTKDELRELIKRNTPFCVKNSKGKAVFPFISIAAQEAVIDTITEGLFKKMFEPNN
jgi:hypothetical protein